VPPELELELVPVPELVPTPELVPPELAPLPKTFPASSPVLLLVVVDPPQAAAKATPSDATKTTWMLLMENLLPVSLPYTPLK
jgi:hypothetical protein